MSQLITRQLFGQWVSLQSEKKVIHSYEGHQGNWRPDLLLLADGKEPFKMCEINARYLFNGIDWAALFHRALSSPEIKPSFLAIPADPDRMFDSLFAMFDPCLPIHFLQSGSFIETRENFMAAFMECAEKRTGMRPCVVRPDKLRLVPDSTSGTGYALYWTSADPGSASSVDQDEKKLEKIHQVGLQLMANEYELLDPQMQHHLALYGVNDFRKLDDLVTKFHALTEEQADLLRRKVVPTILPGSKELQQLIDSLHQGKVSKDNFILKPVRESRGSGILFGDELGKSKWEAILNDLRNPETGQHRKLYVIQPVITQAEEELFLDERKDVIELVLIML